MHALLRFDRHHLVGRMRRKHRQLLALVRNALGLGAGDLVTRRQARRRNPVEHAVARGPRGLRRTVRPPQLGRLRQRDKQGRLRKRQLARLLAEIGQRRRADAFEIAAVGRERQVESKNIVLAEHVFDFKRAHDLPQLRTQSAMLARLQQSRQLHRDGGAA